MNILAAGGFQGFVNAIFENWQMILFVILAVLLLLTIIFRHFKTAVFIITVIAVAIGVVLVINLVTEAISWKLVDLVSFLVRWVPTVIFTATVLLAVLLGVLRGLRKSLILLLHEVIAAAVCITAFAVLVNLPKTDSVMLQIVDAFMGGSGSLQRALKVTAPCVGLKDVFVEWLPTVLGSYGLMLSESKAYIYTLADLIYHIGFALIFYIVFLILDFILYIIYHIFYSERKYKKKIAEKYTQNKVDRRYSKHSVGGGVVGAVRGVTIGLLSLSMLGTVLFSVAGRGEGKLKEYDFGNDGINEYYSIYRSVESYGNYGIFKVLNAVSSPDEAPYYLFAADLIFSGELNDEELEVAGNIVFREELAAYTGFARDTMDLVMKYGGDKIKPLISGTATEKAFDTVLEIMSDEQFKVEFRDLIGEFDAQTYVFNFAMSFINTAIANIDDISFASTVSADNRELLKIIFTKGYLSDVIPDERELKEKGGQDIAPRPYINVAKFITKEDVQILYGVVIDVLTGKTKDANATVDLIAGVIPQLKSVSLLSEERAEELDPVLGRLYCYAANRYLSEEGSEGITYESIYKDGIEWVGEINMLLDVTDAAFGLYKNVYTSGINPYDAMLSIFDKSDKNYEANCAYYDTICDSVIKSRILGKTMSTSYVYNIIEKSLNGVLEGIYIPRGTVYESTFNENGEVVSAGEVYNLLNGVSMLGRNSDLLSMLKGFDGQKDMDEFLNALTEVIESKDDNGKKASDYLVESNLLRSVLSAALINYGADYIYVPNVARESDADGKKVNLITKGELATLFNSLPELVEFVTPIINGGDNVNASIADFVTKETFKNLLESSAVFEGTAAKLLVKAMGDNGAVVIPAALTADYEGWVSETGKTGELKKLLNAIDLAGIEIADAVNGKLDEKAVLDNVLKLSSEQLDGCFDSSVLHYTISKFLLGDNLDFGSFKIIVPAASQTDLKNDSIPSVVKKSELKHVVSLATDFDLSENSDISSVFVKLVQNKEVLDKSYLLSASVVYSIVNSSETADILEIPEALKQAATEEQLKKFNLSNPWKVEVVRLVDALDEILNVSNTENFTFDETKLQDSMSALLKEINGVSSVNPKATKLAVCMGSEVVKNNITVKLDELLEGNIDGDFLYGAKSGGYYTERELSALSNALNIFEIEVDKINADAITDKVKERLFTLNDIPEGKEKSNLEEIYPSMIISGMLSKELDAVLLDKDAEQPAPMIDSDVLYAVKEGDKRYKQVEISLLLSAVDAFEIEDLDGLSELDFDDIMQKRDRLDEICASRIIRGVFTKQIKENNELGVDHPLAYEKDVKILKRNEIESMIDLVDAASGVNSDADLSNMYFDQISLKDLRVNLFEESGSVKSYLVLAAISDSLKTNDQVYVNKRLIDNYGCINANEVSYLLDGFIALEEKTGGDSVNIHEWSARGAFTYPDAATREIALKSEILRAKLTYQIIDENEKLLNPKTYYAGAEKCAVFTDYNTNSYKLVLSENELRALFNVTDDYNTDGKFTIPKMDYETLRAKYAELGTDGGNAYVDKVFASDILRYNISENAQIQTIATGLGYTAEQEDAITLSNSKVESGKVKSYTAEQVKQVMSAFNL